MREAKCCTDVTSEAFGVADGADVQMERAPPKRAAAKRSRKAELGRGERLRRVVYGALSGRLTAEPGGLSKRGERGE